ncbi:RxLR effector protein [Phytophthora ramorum]|uniref:RxLR effector protein n=1 Tax=Phytophthora ramorum TaxID=164328 RepID=UPI0030A4DE74|nr:RxLR effector protein [Phytophthora ramorum]
MSVPIPISNHVSFILGCDFGKHFPALLLKLHFPVCLLDLKASMHLSTIVLLVFATILVSPAVVHSQQSSISKTSANPHDVFATDEDVAAPRRKLLRSNLVVDSDESDSDDRAQAEERALPGTSKIAQLVSKFGSSQKLSNTLWLKARENPASVFKILKLGKAGEKLDENPKFLQWLHYVQSFQRQGHFPDYSVYFLLRDHMPEATVATLLQSLKQVPGVELLAKKVQVVQFERWFNLQKKPDHFATEVLGVKNGLSSLPANDPKKEILTEYMLHSTRLAAKGSD